MLLFTGEMLYNLKIFDNDSDLMTSQIMFASLFIPYNVNGNIENVLLYNEYSDNGVAHIYTTDHENKCINYYDSIHHGHKVCDKMLYDSKRQKILMVVMKDKAEWYEWKFIH